MTISKAQDLSYKLATLRLQKEPKARTQPQTNAWLKPMAKLLEEHNHGHIASVLDWVYAHGDWQTAKTPAVFKSHFYSINEAMKIDRELRKVRYNPFQVVLDLVRTIGGRTR